MTDHQVFDAMLTLGGTHHLALAFCAADDLNQQHQRR